MKLVVIIIMLSMFNGCGGGNNKSNRSLLVGVWITEQCEQAMDENDEPVNIWGKGLYEFTTQGTVTVGQATHSAEGTIRFGRKMYSDSNCETVAETTVPSELDPPVLYQDLGGELLQEGIPGNELVIIFPTPNSTESVSGFYTLNTGSLCFSENYIFEPFRFGVSLAGSSAIDFVNCLVQVEAP